MNKFIKLLFLLLLPVVASVVLTGCEDYEEKLTGSNPEGNAVDVSTRITGFNSDVSGAGSTLTALGSNLSGVIRVYFPESSTYGSDIEASDSEVSFRVPANVPLGVQDLIFIFSGNERATASIEMVPLPVIEYFDLQQGNEGDVITVYGLNMDFVTDATVGGVTASISDLTAGTVNVTVPSGAATGKIGLVTPAGNTESTLDFYVCSDTPDSYYCQDALNGNVGFEAGTVGIIGEGGDLGGGGFTAGSPGAQWEIVETPGGAPGLGDLSLKVTLNELQNNGVDAWRIQLVLNQPLFGDFDGFEVQPNRRFAMLAKVWSDANGRTASISAATRTPCCTGFVGGQTFTLSQGWNILEIEVQHSVGDHDGGNDTHAAMEVNINYPENLGGVIYIDDVRLVDIGPYQE